MELFYSQLSLCSLHSSGQISSQWPEPELCPTLHVQISQQDPQERLFHLSLCKVAHSAFAAPRNRSAGEAAKAQQPQPGRG